MAARLGIKDDKFEMYKDMGFDEIQIIHKSGVYPYRPQLNPEDWDLLKKLYSRQSARQPSSYLYRKRTKKATAI